MKIISHRGNIDGPNLKYENHPDYILDSIVAGFEVEIDVWFHENEYHLGHDYPQYRVPLDWLVNESFWCHAKNTQALEKMKIHGLNNYFWHDSDRYTITSAGHIWCYPNNPTTVGILVHLDKPKTKLDVFGICSDYANEWKAFVDHSVDTNQTCIHNTTRRS